MLPKGALKRARARTEDSFGSAVRAKGVLHIEKIAIMALQLGNKLAQSQHWKRRGEERKKGKSVAFVCARIRLSLSTKAASSDQIHLNPQYDTGGDLANEARACESARWDSIYLFKSVLCAVLYVFC